ncbi:MAG: PCRF domain-containing protein, partial [Bacteroidota bacterium]
MANIILEKLEGVKSRFDEVGELITNPDVISDMDRYVKLNKEYKNLEPIIDTYKNYKNILSN